MKVTGRIKVVKQLTSKKYRGLLVDYMDRPNIGTTMKEVDRQRSE